MMPWLIDFTNQRVVIVGGGKVAYRKAKAFLQEGALVSIVASEMKEEFSSLECQKIYKDYDIDDIKDAFFVFAATSSKTKNQQIVDDALKQKIMCASATKTNTPFHGMATIHTNQMTLGVSTNGQYPALSLKLKNDLKGYDDYLEVLSLLRVEILNHQLVEENQRQSFFHSIMLLSLEELKLLYTMVLQRQGIVLLFPHHINEEAYSFASFAKALIFSCQESDYQQKLETLLMIHIKWNIQPMTISEGIIYKRIKQTVPIPVLSALFKDQELMNKLYQQPEKRLFLIHPSPHQHLYHLLNQYGDVTYFDHIPQIKDYDRIIPFILQKGYHYHQDIQKIKEALLGHYQYFDSVLLENDEVKNIIIDKIYQSRQGE